MTENLLEPTFAKTETEKKRILGYAADRIPHERVNESPLGNLVADAMRVSINSQIAVMNPGGVRAGLEEGPITYESVFRALPFDNTISRLQLTGKELKLMIRIAEGGSKGWFSVSGLKVRAIDLQHEPNSSDLDRDGQIAPWELDRLIEVTLTDGTPIQDSKMYDVATIDFLVTGGDSMGWFMNQIPKSRIQINAGPMLRDGFVEYLSQFKEPLNSDKNPLVKANAPRIQLEAPPKKSSKRQKSVGSKKRSKAGSASKKRR